MTPPRLITIKDADSAVAFLAGLAAAGLLYHPEESAFDCLAHHGLPSCVLQNIQDGMRATFLHLSDPCATALQFI
jgi:hypothetical protein